MENVAKELDCIIKTGHYNFFLGTNSSMEDDCFEAKSSQIYLEYEINTGSPPQSGVNPKTSNTEKQLSSNVKSRKKQCLNDDQINDFLRKLGFIDKEKEGDHSIKNFLYLSQVRQT